MVTGTESYLIAQPNLLTGNPMCQERDTQGVSGRESWSVMTVVEQAVEAPSTHTFLSPPLPRPGISSG